MIDTRNNMAIHLIALLALGSPLQARDRKARLAHNRPGCAIAEEGPVSPPADRQRRVSLRAAGERFPRGGGGLQNRLRIFSKLSARVLPIADGQFGG